MSGSSSTAQTNDMAAAPPVTPTPTRSRSAPRGGVTPERPARAPRTTYELPSGVRHRPRQHGRDDGTYGRPDGPRPPVRHHPERAERQVQQAVYEGSKPNLGYIAVLVVKDEDMALVSMSFKTVPWQIGKPVLGAMSKTAVAKGFSGLRRFQAALRRH